MLCTVLALWNIPNFIARKHGEEEIEYDLPEMAEILADTLELRFTKSK